jgi:AcrR family transcriptional regulator
MAGTKRFICDEVLDKAARVFWRVGYEAASIQALEQETGLGRGSLYNAFGDKAGLYLAVLDRYAATEGAAPLVHLDNPDIRAGIEALLRTIAARMDMPGRPRGCLLTNACIGVHGDAAVEARVAAHVAGVQGALAAAIGRAATAGQIPRNTDPLTLAQYYAAVIRGLGVSHRSGSDRVALDAVIDVAMRAWPEQ